ncbi:MAG TPA: ABC transporter permease [Trebonia sp.]|nr:ABC transporter permease [Trebonia sp.]
MTRQLIRDGRRPAVRGTAARSRLQELAAALAARYALLAVGAVIFAAFSLAMPGVYDTAGSVRTMLSTEAVPLVLAVGAIFPLRCGDFDLSIASNMVVSAAVVAIATVSHHVSPLAACLLALAAGAGIGLVNGILVVLLDINAFIVTLGMMTLLDGLAFGITNGTVVSGLPSGLLTFGRTYVLGLPLAVFYGWALVLAACYLLEFTPFGRYLLFVGGNREAAALSGVPVTRTRLLSFVLAGLVSAFAGILLASQLGSVDTTVSDSFLLPAYAAAFLSTTVLQLGRYNALGALIGTYLLTAGITGLLSSGAAPWVSQVLNGGVLIAAVAFSRIVSRRRRT